MGWKLVPFHSSSALENTNFEILVFYPRGKQGTPGPELPSHLKMSPESPKDRAGDGSEDPVVCDGWSISTAPSLNHFKLLRKSKDEAFKTFYICGFLHMPNKHLTEKFTEFTWLVKRNKK